MPPPNLAALRAVADRLDSLGLDYAFVTPVAFFATKYIAFLDRGKGDYYASHDLEDFITVIDGRESIVTEVAAAPEALRTYIIEAVRMLLAQPAFNESLSGHLPSDEASQRRLPTLRRKLHAIAGQD